MRVLGRTAALVAGSFAVYLAVSCGSDPERGAAADDDAGPDGAPSATSGSRLRARWRIENSPDGARRRSFAGWFDTARGEACDVVLYRDDHYRCVPSARLGMSIAYADSSCTQPIVSIPKNVCVGPLPQYAAKEIYDCEKTWTEVWRIGASTAAPAKLWAKFDVGCTETRPPPGDFAYYEASAVAPSDLVEISVTHTTD
jgi:hypothetical protein